MNSPWWAQASQRGCLHLIRCEIVKPTDIVAEPSTEGSEPLLTLLPRGASMRAECNVIWAGRAPHGAGEVGNSREYLLMERACKILGECFELRVLQQPDRETIELQLNEILLLPLQILIPEVALLRRR